MDKFIIQGGRPLNGTVVVQGAKNALLPLMAAVVLRPGAVRFTNASHLKDTAFLGEIIESLGGFCTWTQNECTVDTTQLTGDSPGYEYVSKMRASFLLLGALIGRFGRAKIPLPGGCSIGERPVQWHLEALRALGARVEIISGHVVASCTQLRGAEICLPYPTVGGTQNTIMAAAFAQGETVIKNAAREPEVADLCRFLKESGVPIEGIGEAVVRIQGVDDLCFPETYAVIPDRIEAITYAVAVGIAGGRLILDKSNMSLMEASMALLQEAGVSVESHGGHTVVEKKGELQGFSIVTHPYPGLPTDVQALFMALALYCNGKVVIKETVFSHRFMHVLEFARMGAEVAIQGDTVTVQGGKPLTGAPVMASDLRAGAALVLAGLGASGTTEVSRVYHIDRGYVGMECKLQAVGADIKRVSQ